MRYSIYIAWLLAAITTQAQVGFRSIPFVSVSTQPASGAPAAAWSPTNLNLQVFYDANSIAGNLGDSISAWPNLQPQWPQIFATNNNAADKPFLTNGFPQGTGTNKALAFGWVTTNYFDITNAAWISSNVASATIWAVVQFPDVPKERVILWDSTASSTTERAVATVDSAETFNSYGRTDDSDAVSSVESKALTTNTCWLLQADLNFAAGTNIIYTNWIFANGTNLASAANSESTASVRVRVGAGSATAGTSMRGWISSMGFGAPAISDANRSNLWQWAKAKYGL